MHAELLPPPPHSNRGSSLQFASRRHDHVQPSSKPHIGDQVIPLLQVNQVDWSRARNAHLHRMPLPRPPTLPRPPLQQRRHTPSQRQQYRTYYPKQRQYDQRRQNWGKPCQWHSGLWDWVKDRRGQGNKWLGRGREEEGQWHCGWRCEIDAVSAVQAVCG